MSDPSRAVRALVLGAGRVGRTIVFDLAAEPNWTVGVADLAATGRDDLPSDVERFDCDLSDPAVIREVADGFDLIVGALPSALGYEALRAVLESGRHYVDISFFEEDPFSLHELAQEKGAVAVVDCGLAPGSDNLLAGYATTQMDPVENFLCAVGGLPVARSWPWEYKAPFAPQDVINEYKRPARIVIDGKTVVRPALSECELMEFSGVGTLEAFNTDGLRTLVDTLSIPTMREMTLRYPGHAEKMRALRESGFFSEEPIRVGDVEVRPLDLTSRLLFDQWAFAEGEGDVTVMRVVIEGSVDGRSERWTYELRDLYDPKSGFSSMARTTGFSCTAIARMVADGTFARQGVSAAEHVGQAPGCYERFMAELASRNVSITRTVEAI